jgi:hypothetical protein
MLQAANAFETLPLGSCYSDTRVPSDWAKRDSFLWSGASETLDKNVQRYPRYLNAAHAKVTTSVPLLLPLVVLLAPLDDLENGLCRI